MRRRHPDLSRLLALLALGAALAVPSQALGHASGLGAGDEPRDPDAASTLQAREAAALATLPRESASGTCRETDHVDGIGDACRTDEGLFRVRLASGVSLETHGGDAPADIERAAARPHLPDTQDAVDGASVADVECTTAPSDRRVELVYAYPADKPDRSAVMADPMRSAIYQASAFVDAEAQALDPSAGRRIRVACSAGVPIVNVVQVRAIGTTGGDYDDIVDDLVAQGYPAPTSNTSSTRRFMVFYDHRSASGSAGIGGIWLDDDAGPGNYNNLGARYAVEFDWSAARVPHWDVFLHEITHNMGAVADAAPDASGAGHCNDGLDVMCYADGGPLAAYSSTACAVERYDCGGDSYFHPDPAPGGWLDTHWNVGSTDNFWLAARDTGWNDGGVPDVTAPSAVTGLAISSRSQGGLGATWLASTDDRSAVRYRVVVDRLDSGSWQLDSTWTPLSATSLTVGQLASGTTYRFRVTAFDQAGNETEESSITTSTLAAPPTPPASAALTVVDASTLDAAWAAGSAGAGVRGHELELQRGFEAWTRISELAGTTTRLSQLASGASWRIRVRTVANDGAVSAWRVSAYVTTPGELAGGGDEAADPVTPTLQVELLGATRARVTWTSSPGSAHWVLRLTDASGTLRTIGTSTTSVSLASLKPNHPYAVSVVAISADASRSSDAAVATMRTPRDTTRPGLVRMAAPRYVGTTMRLSWRAASDDAGIARYQLQRRIGTRWRSVPTVGTRRLATIRGIRRGSTTILRIRAVDVGGNAGVWSTSQLRRR